MTKWEHFLIAEQEDKTCIQGIPFQGTRKMEGKTKALESYLECFHVDKKFWE